MFANALCIVICGFVPVFLLVRSCSLLVWDRNFLLEIKSGELLWFVSQSCSYTPFEAALNTVFARTLTFLEGEARRDKWVYFTGKRKHAWWSFARLFEPIWCGQNATRMRRVGHKKARQVTGFVGSSAVILTSVAFVTYPVALQCKCVLVLVPGSDPECNLTS